MKERKVHLFCSPPRFLVFCFIKHVRVEVVTSINDKNGSEVCFVEQVVVCETSDTNEIYIYNK